MAEGAQVQKISREKFKEISLLSLILACLVLYRLYFMRFYDVMSADGTSYATAGKNFFQTLSPQAFGTVFPPLYPFFIGLFNLIIKDLEISARVVSVFFSTLTVIPLYLMTRHFYGKTAGF